MSKHLGRNKVRKIVDLLNSGYQVAEVAEDQRCSEAQVYSVKNKTSFVDIIEERQKELKARRMQRRTRTKKDLHGEGKSKNASLAATANSILSKIRHSIEECDQEVSMYKEEIGRLQQEINLTDKKKEAFVKLLAE